MAAPRYDIPAGNLADALAALGRQANIDIGGNDAGLASVRVRRLASDGPPPRLLDRLLKHTQYRAVALPSGGFRIVRKPAIALAPPSTLPSIRQAEASRSTVSRANGDIVVVASKRERLLSQYPGGTVVLRSSDDAFGPIGGGGTDWMLGRTPVLQSTELGEGRNKLFIRGIADSSFAGPTQATVSTYFGGVRVGYSGPDPNLNLYDIDRVEILEGPQGTLYGAGSLGGIILLNPHDPDLKRAAASAEIGGSTTRHGGLGYDSAGMVNLVAWPDHVGIRLVAYRSREGGYIDATNYGKNRNTDTQTGGRLSVRVRPIDGMTVDASYILQSSQQPDLQYSNPILGPLIHGEAIQQPFSDHFRMGRLVAEQRLAGGWTLSVSAGRVTHDTQQIYDASHPPAAAMSYEESINIALTTVEAHVGQSLRNGRGWLLGFSAVWDTTSAGRTLGLVNAPRDLIGVSNRTQERAGYGEYTLPIGGLSTITAGVRYTSARMDGEPSRTPTNKDYIKGQTTKRFDPELGLTHRFSPQLQWFAQYSQGFRTGGLAVAAGAGRVATYRSDHVNVGQTGFRYFRKGDTGISAYAAASYARWSDIQADLVASNGFPLTANVGDGRILTFESSATWTIVPDIELRGAIMLNRSRLVDPQPAYVSSGSRPLPASPAVTATGRAAWAHQYGWARLRADLHMRYTGNSRLGVGPLLDIPYGNFAETGATAAAAKGNIELSIGVENLLDTRGNRFAIGNPLAIFARNEVTPLRPRTVRLGLSTAF